MYPPPHHQENDFNKIVEVIKQFPLATLISPVGNECFTTHVPVLYKANGSQFGKLIGHIDAENPHCNYLINQRVFLVFHGPNAYISPTAYTTAQFPTWNYIKVHIEGSAKLITDAEAIKQILINLATENERPGSAFKLENDNPRMNHLVNYIRGFEIKIEKWEGKFKLGQDKIEADKNAATEILIANTPVSSQSFVQGIINN